MLTPYKKKYFDKNSQLRIQQHFTLLQYEECPTHHTMIAYVTPKEDQMAQITLEYHVLFDRIPIIKRLKDMV